MTRKKLANGLTQQQDDFCRYYTDIGIGYKALIKAYPSAAKWTRASADSYVNKLLNNTLIMTRIEELNAKKTSALMESTKISHRKLLETALSAMIECNTPAERQHFVSLIKLLFQKEGMLQPETALQVNIQNNTVLNELTDYLDL